MAISLSTAQALFHNCEPPDKERKFMFRTATCNDGHAVNQDRFGRLILVCQTSEFKDFTN